MASQRSTNNREPSLQTDDRGKFSALYALGFAVVLVTSTVAAGIAIPSDMGAQNNPENDVDDISSGVNSSIHASAKDTGPGGPPGVGDSETSSAASAIPGDVWEDLDPESKAALNSNLGNYLDAVKRDMSRSGEITRLEPVEGEVEAGAVIQQHETGEHEVTETVETEVTVEEEYEDTVVEEVTKTKTVEKQVIDHWETRYSTYHPGGDWQLAQRDAKDILVECQKTATGWEPSYEACHDVETVYKTSWLDLSDDGWTRQKFEGYTWTQVKETTESTTKPGSGWTYVEDTGKDTTVTKQKTKVSSSSPGPGWERARYMYTDSVEVEKTQHTVVGKSTNPADWTPPGGVGFDRCTLRNKGFFTHTWDCYRTYTVTKQVTYYEWTKTYETKEDVIKWKTYEWEQKPVYTWTKDKEVTHDSVYVSADKYKKPVYTTVEEEVEYTENVTKTVTKTKNVTKTVTEEETINVTAAPFTHDGNANWTFASGVTETRDSSLTVSAKALDETDSSPLTLKAVDQSGDTWWLKVYKDPDTGDIVVETSTGISEQYDVDQVRIDFDAGTINGNDVGLTLGAGLDQAYELKFKNGDSAIGAYRFIVNGDAEVDSSYTPADDAPDVAVADDILYSATFDVTLEDEETVYTDRVTVEPDVNLEKPTS